MKRDRPASPQRCFFVVASCQYKAKQGDWDKLDCVNDNKVVDCCQFECSKCKVFIPFYLSKIRIFILAKKQVAFQKAKEAYQKIIEGETKATLDQLQKLENQRQKILHQLKNARERVVKRLPTNDPKDFFTVASLPQQTKDELMTLAQVAQAVIHSKVHLEPEIQTDLEETIAENLVELTKEAINEQKNDVIVKSPEKVEDYNDNVYDMTSDELQEFIDANDIIKAQDPFSKFLRKEMGM